LEGAEGVDASPKKGVSRLKGLKVLVDVGGHDSERLYVIPEEWACGELRSYATLCSAGSYGDVLADEHATSTVIDAMWRQLDDLPEGQEDLDERGLFDWHVKHGTPFDADQVFGEEGRREWCPSADESSAAFAEMNAPDVWERFKRLDDGWGIDYDPSDYLPAEEREQVLAALRALGCEVHECPGLTGMYNRPSDDLVSRIDAGKWPPQTTRSEKG
jgi:hypothetical protein